MQVYLCEYEYYDKYEPGGFAANDFLFVYEPLLGLIISENLMDDFNHVDVDAMILEDWIRYFESFNKAVNVTKIGRF